MNHSCRGVDRVIGICKALGANHYINPIGGFELYNKESFIKSEIDLQFLETKKHTYKQFDDMFIPFLSIIDVLMFNSTEKTKKMLNFYMTK